MLDVDELPPEATGDRRGGAAGADVNATVRREDIADPVAAAATDECIVRVGVLDLPRDIQRIEAGGVNVVAGPQVHVGTHEDVDRRGQNVPDDAVTGNDVLEEVITGRCQIDGR